MKRRWIALGLILIVHFAHADERIRRVQEELRKRNLYFGDIDGRDTPQLAAALKRYQERKGFRPTGSPDADTLHSLDIGSPPPNIVSWPDVAVLRSDAAREEPVANVSPSPAPLPVAEGPDTAPSDENRFAPENVRKYIEHYLHDCEINDLDAEMSYYANSLDYFDHGIVDQQFVKKDVEAYYKRWPERKYELVSLTQSPAAPDGKRQDQVQVNFRIRFSVKNENHVVQGMTDDTFILKDTGSGYKLISLQEQRVR